LPHSRHRNRRLLTAVRHRRPPPPAAVAAVAAAVGVGVAQVGVGASTRSLTSTLAANVKQLLPAKRETALTKVVAAIMEARPTPETEGATRRRAATRAATRARARERPPPSASVLDG
jgi:hypothetical protein